MCYNWSKLLSSSIKSRQVILCPDGVTDRMGFSIKTSVVSPYTSNQSVQLNVLKLIGIKSHLLACLKMCQSNQHLYCLRKLAPLIVY